MPSANDVPRKRQPLRPMTLWRSVAIYGSCWFWLFFGTWALLQCFRAECAFVQSALTNRLPYTLAAWAIGALLFGSFMWFFQHLMSWWASRE